MALPDYLMLIPDDWDSFVLATSQTYAQMANINHTYLTSACTLFGGSSTGGECTKDVSAQSYTSGWCAFHMNCAAPAGDNVVAEFKGGSGQVLLRMSTITNTEHWMWEYYNGSGFTQIGSDETTFNLATARRFDVFWDILDSGGSFDIYLDGSLWNSFSGDTKTTADTTIDTVRFVCNGTSGGQTTNVGGVIIDSADTRKLQIEEVTSSTAGTRSEYTGSENDIDTVVGAGGIGTYISFDANGERATFNWTAFDASITDSWTVEGVSIVTINKAPVAPGFYLQGLAYISGADFDGDNAKIVRAGAETHFFDRLDFDVNPSTSVAWANKSEVDAVELGYKALVTPTV